MTRKSQIAVEFVYRYSEMNPSHHILWVHCSNCNRFSQAYKSIARRLNVPGLDQSNEDPLRLVTDCLNDPKRQWLMVLDNVDDVALLEPKSTETDTTRFSINAYLPKKQSGRLLITSRDRRIGERLVDSLRTIDVGTPSQEDAVQMIRNRFHASEIESDSTDKLESLAKSLAFIPLAMTQAAAYICENGDTVEAYLEFINSRDGEFEELLQSDFGDQRRDDDNFNSVYKSWKVSFDCIQKQNPVAANILALMCILDRQGVPRELLRKEAKNEVTFRLATTLLRKFCLVEEHKKSEQLEMHRLVHICMQTWIREQGKELYWQDRALTYVDDDFSVRLFETWRSCEKLLPHATILIHLQLDDAEQRLKIALLLCKCGYYQINAGNYKAAIASCDAALEIEQAILGDGHSDTLITSINLAVAHKCVGNYDEAEKFALVALEGWRKGFGEGSPMTLKAKKLLSDVYLVQGRLDEAEKILSPAVETSQRLQGSDNEVTLVLLSGLASVYSAQGQSRNAVEMLSEVVDIQKRIKGEKHPETLRTLADLATANFNIGEIEHAEEIETLVLNCRKQEVGPTHPYTLDAMTSLASTYVRLGRFKDAEKMHLEAREIKRQELGDGHPSILDNERYLAICYQAQNKYDEAEKILAGSLGPDIRRRGKKVAATRSAMHTLAFTYHRQGRLDEAEKLYLEVLETEKDRHPTHQSQIMTKQDIISLYLERQQFEAAEQHFADLMQPDVQASLDGEWLLKMLGLKHKFALGLSQQRRFEESEQLYLEVIEEEIRHLGLNHENTIRSTINLVEVYWQQGRSSEAEKVLVEIFERSKGAIGEDNIQTKRAKQGLAKLYKESGREEEAKQLLEEAKAPIQYDHQ